MFPQKKDRSVAFLSSSLVSGEVAHYVCDNGHTGDGAAANIASIATTRATDAASVGVLNGPCSRYPVFGLLGPTLGRPFRSRGAQGGSGTRSGRGSAWSCASACVCVRVRVVLCCVALRVVLWCGFSFTFCVFVMRLV